MGNAASIEAPSMGSKATQRLSKPLTTHPTTAGLLNSTGSSDITRQLSSSTGRLFSLTFGPTRPPSPSKPESDSAMADGPISPNGVAALEDCSSRSVFHYNAPHEGVLRQRSQSVGVMTSPIRGPHMLRTDSDYMRTEEGYYEHSQMGFTTSPSNTSPATDFDMTSSYEFPSYEAERFLNVMEDHVFENQPVASETQFQVPLSRRQSHTASYHPAQSDIVALLPRSSPDVSLYAPLRRRSLLTPGVATRPSPADPVMSPAIATTNSPPPTLACCNPAESIEDMVLPIPRSPVDPSIVSRANTPCEADYKQTGAFKHGTLRITNGSPTATPAREATDDGLCSNGSSSSIRSNTYSDGGGQAIGKQKMISDGGQPLVALSLVNTSSVSLASTSVVATNEQKIIYCLPELKLTMSSFSIDQITGFEQKSPKIRPMSRLTHDEDRSFENGLPEYDAGILNMLDHDAKSPSSLPGSPSEGKQKQAMSRSDIGIMTCPTSEGSPKSLSKADSGYSSNASVRSLSSKQNSRREINTRKREEIASQLPTSVHENLSITTSMCTTPANASPKERHQSSSPNEKAVLVPEKVTRTNITIHDIARSSDSQEPASKGDLLSDRTVVFETSKSSHDSFQSGARSTSNSGTGKVRKPGLLKRLLSGSRTSMAGHFIHDPGGEASTSSSSQPTHANSLEHIGSGSLESHTLRVDGVDESELPTAIGTSHNSMDRIPQGAGVTSKPDRDTTRGIKSNLRLLSISSTINRAASSVMGKNSIRKPSPAVAKPTVNDTIHPSSGIPSETPRHPDETPQKRREVERSIESGLLNPTAERIQYGGPASEAGRSNSLSISLERRNPRIYDDALRSHLASQNDRYKIACQKRSLTSPYSISSTPPPVSMKTRQMGVVGQRRLPSAIRPHSTHRSERSTVLRNHNREAIPSHLYKSVDASHGGLPRRSNRETCYGSPTVQTKTFSGGLHQASTIRSSDHHRQVEYLVPGRNSRPVTVLVQEPSFKRSRRNSLGSHTSQQGVVGNRQVWPQHSHNDRPVLRHRSSYDGYPFQARQGHWQEKENGARRSLLLTDGRTYMPDQYMFQQSGQYQQLGGHVAPGQMQHYSLDQYGYPIPSRALYSCYNPPAYRGMPIWSS